MIEVQEAKVPMGESSAWASLEGLCARIDVTVMPCCHCARKVQPDEGLPRTFILKNQYILLPEPLQVAERLDVPSLHDTISIFHHHLKCLFHYTLFVAISHVWNVEVAELQYKKNETTASANNVEQILRDVCGLVCPGVISSIPNNVTVEVWHDYNQHTPMAEGS